MQQRLGLDADDDLQPMSDLTGPRAVLVDFTADWCPNCHLYENTVLRSPAVAGALQRLNVGTVKADWTHRKKAYEVSRMLNVLGCKQIPVIAIFSPADPNHPTVFRGYYTQQQILDALEKANASSPPQLASAAR